jgi:uncharacterized protein YukE
LIGLPLGVMAVYSQVSAHMSDRARVTQRALEEHFVRTGLQRPEFGGKRSDLDSTARSVVHAAANIGYLLNRMASLTSELQESWDWAIAQADFEGTAESGAGCKWSLLAQTRLFEPVRERGEGEMLRFANRDILCYCLALASRYACLDLNPSLTQLQNKMGELARQIKSYEDALWENDAAWRL